LIPLDEKLARNSLLNSREILDSASKEKDIAKKL
jgi:hypothetical protein